MKFKRNENSAPISRILCVEDDFDSCSLLEFMLGQENAGYKVASASTAEKALNLMKKQRFDLYILDFRLPGMSGIELCRKIRETDKLTPIIFFTAMARPADRSVGMAAGANEYLVKPNDLFFFTQTVKRLLAKRKTKSAASRRENQSNFALEHQMTVTVKDTLW